MPNIQDQYVTTTEAARVLDIHPAALQKLFQSDRLPADKIANRWLVRRSVLEKFAQTYEPRVGRPRKYRR